MSLITTVLNLQGRARRDALAAARARRVRRLRDESAGCEGRPQGGLEQSAADFARGATRHQQDQP